MFRFTYSVTTKASPARAWEIFSDWRRWNQFADVYGQLRWSEGHPWQAGSRMAIELVRPVNVILEHVITSCLPGRKVGWIDHGLGVAMAQWVNFNDLGAKGTQVHTWGDVMHSGVVIAGRSVEQLIASFTETWYENFRVACDRLIGTPLAEADD
ncbi:MAG: hypothetical protein ACRD36_04500 [Candidatus Acidiferrum sp.]